MHARAPFHDFAHARAFFTVVEPEPSCHFVRRVLCLTELGTRDTATCEHCTTRARAKQKRQRTSSRIIKYCPGAASFEARVMGTTKFVGLSLFSTRIRKNGALERRTKNKLPSASLRSCTTPGNTQVRTRAHTHARTHGHPTRPPGTPTQCHTTHELPAHHGYSVPHTHPLRARE